jgi:hypothetical protein
LIGVPLGAPLALPAVLPAVVPVVLPALVGCVVLLDLEELLHAAAIGTNPNKATIHTLRTLRTLRTFMAPPFARSSDRTGSKKSVVNNCSLCKPLSRSLTTGFTDHHDKRVNAHQLSDSWS